jgi:DNA-binding FrmR family transcriptional regulator
MQLDQDELAGVIRRLKSASGHLTSVIRMLEEGADCEAALTQLAAVNKGIGRASFALMTTGLQKCLADGGDSAAAEKLEKLFLSFA